MKGFNCQSRKRKKQHKSEVIATKIHKSGRRISSVKSINSKLHKDPEKCFDNAKKPDVDMVSLLSKGNVFHKVIKGNKGTFK